VPIRPWFLAILLPGLLGDFAVTVIVIPLDTVRIVFFGDLLVGELLFRLLQVHLQALLLALAVRRIALTNIGDIGLAEAVTKLLRVDVTAALCHSGVKTFCAWNAKANRGTADLCPRFRSIASRSMPSRRVGGLVVSCQQGTPRERLVWLCRGILSRIDGHPFGLESHSQLVGALS
jgi:hypothetical protein